jgi:hypothetical protein
MKKYQVTATETHLQAISQAVDLAQRVQLGQWREIKDFLPLREDIDHGALYNDLNRIGEILSKYMIGGVNGWESSLGIGHRDLPDSNSTLYDVHCAIRHKLAWERAVEQGVVESEGSPRKWPEMMQVSYDTPMHYGSEPLLEIVRCQD